MSSLPRSLFQWSLAIAIVLGPLCAASASAAAIVDLTPLEGLPVDGAAADGVTFGYTEFGFASPDAFGQDIGTSEAQYVQGPSVVGYSDGVLTLSFAHPAWQISFGVAETTNASLTPGFSVSVYNAAGDLLDSANVDTNPLVLLSEGEFTYAGPNASTVVITFDSVDANEFAFGGLSYAVPEPASVAVFAAGLMILGMVVARRRQS